MSIQKAFSLIELMVVIAIVAVLSAVALPAYKTYTVKAKLSKVVSLTESYRTKVLEYYNRTGSIVTSPSDIGIPADGTDTREIAASALPNDSSITKIRVYNDGFSGAIGRITVFVPATSLGVVPNESWPEFQYSFRLIESNGTFTWTCFLGGGSNQYLGVDANNIVNHYIPIPPCVWQP